MFGDADSRVTTLRPEEKFATLCFATLQVAQTLLAYMLSATEAAQQEYLA